MARVSKEFLEELKKKHNVSTIWSFSRYNTYKNCKYEYMLKYIKRIKEDRGNSIYTYSGGYAHTILEELYEGKIKYEDMLEKYEDELVKFNMVELKYNRSNEEKNQKTADKYEDCLRHFFQNHNKIKYKMVIEKYITWKIGKHLFNGYIDAIYKDYDGCYNIIDWKTSSIYQGAKVLKEGKQLILYAEALRQNGVPLDKIKAYWNFLKYVTVDMPQANGKIRTSNISRHEIGSKLASNVKMWLKKTERYSDEQVDDLIDLISQTNDISVLPDDVKEKYTIRDCYVEIPLSELIINDLKDDVKRTVDEILTNEVAYHKSQDESIFWQEVTDSQSFYFSNLCSYSRKLHKPYDEYLKIREEKLGREEKGTDEVGESEDMTWLEEL